MQFGKDETDAATPVPPAAAADDGETEEPDTEFGTMKDWARLFTQLGQEDLLQSTRSWQRYTTHKSECLISIYHTLTNSR